MTLCLPELPARMNASLNFVAILLGLKSLERKSTIHSLVPYDTSTSNPTFSLFMPAGSPSYRELSWEAAVVHEGEEEGCSPSTMDERSMKNTLSRISRFVRFLSFQMQQYGGSWFGRWILGWNWIVAKSMTRFGIVSIPVDIYAIDLTCKVIFIPWQTSSRIHRIAKEVNYTPTSKTVKTLFHTNKWTIVHTHTHTAWILK